MFVGVHLLTGAAIGATVHHPAAAVGLAVLSHYAVDHLPHWNYLPKYKSIWEDTYKMASEPLISIPLFGALAWYLHWDAPILIAAIAATLPDFIEAAQYYLRSKLLKWHSRWHHWGHWHARFLPALPVTLSLLALNAALLWFS